jgi:hypothetical protein
VVQVQLHLTIAAAHKPFERGEILIDRLFGGIEPRVLPRTSSGITMTVSDLRVLIHPLLSQPVALPRFEMIGEEEEDVSRAVG